MISRTHLREGTATIVSRDRTRPLSGRQFGSIFRYPGGKSRASFRRRILGVAPEFAEYREPFVGGGGIFFAVPPEIPRWINDLDKYLIRVYKALRDRPEQFIGDCRGILPYQKGGDNTHLAEWFDRIAHDKWLDPALRYLYVNRTVFGGRVNYSRPSRLYFSKPSGWTQALLDSLPEASRLLQGTLITAQDYSVVLEEPGEGVWIYCDPPYYRPDLRSTGLLYRHNFQWAEDHERFAEAVRNCSHRVAISYQDDDQGAIRSLYRGFEILAADHTYVGSTLAKKRRGRELLILNYEPPRRENAVGHGLEN